MLGRGYRRVHLFTEEHAALDGSRSVVQPDRGLRPESSWNINLSGSWSTGDDTYTATVSGHVFSTLFTDRIYADYDSLPNAIVYRNIDGIGWNRGFGGDALLTGASGWTLFVGSDGVALSIAGGFPKSMVERGLAMGGGH